MAHNCDQAIEEMYYFLDGEITWYKRIRIRRHLRRCHTCDDAFAFETRFKSIVRQRSREEPPPELIDRLRTFLHEHEADERRA